MLLLLLRLLRIPLTGVMAGAAAATAAGAGCLTLALTAVAGGLTFGRHEHHMKEREGRGRTMALAGRFLVNLARTPPIAPCVRVACKRPGWGQNWRQEVCHADHAGTMVCPGLTAPLTPSRAQLERGRARTLPQMQRK